MSPPDDLGADLWGRLTRLQTPADPTEPYTEADLRPLDAAESQRYWTMVIRAAQAGGFASPAELTFVEDFERRARLRARHGDRPAPRHVRRGVAYVPDPSGAPRPPSPGFLGQVVGGVQDALLETSRAVFEAADWLDRTFLDPAAYAALPRHSPRASITRARVAQSLAGTVMPPPADLGEGLARGTTQFLTGFLPATRALRALGVARPVGQALGASALADALVFDPHSPRVSNLVHELAPALRTPITEYLAASPDDTAAEGRLKNALEGLGFDLAVGLGEGLVHVVRAMRAARLARETAPSAPRGRVTP